MTLSENQMLRWQREDGRFYEVTITRDLFEQWAVIKLFGGAKKGGSNLVYISCESKQAALEMVEQIAKRREKHGYTMVGRDLLVTDQD